MGPKEGGAGKLSTSTYTFCLAYRLVGGGLGNGEPG